MADGGHGKNYLVLGPMFSGKSTELLKVVDRSERHQRLLVVSLKPAVDRRWETGHIRTHSGRVLSADALVSDGESCVREVTARCLAFRANHGEAPRKVVVVLDECQFVPDLARFGEWVVDHRRELPDVEIEAHYAGLDGTAREKSGPTRDTVSRKMFPEVSALLPHCEKVKKLAAVCMCCQARSASFTRFLNPSELEPVPGSDDDDDAPAQQKSDSDPFLRLGAEDIYRAVCGPCDARCVPLCGKCLSV